MWVRSQNKKELINCTSFSVTKNIGGRKKSAVTGSISNGIWGRREILLGLYDTRDSALNELTMLQEALVNNTKVYEMS
ncbi:hypothetical protein CIL05_20005 [Virgibacillus profundi]|uniref:Uncharacterized protein n=2 Tax=Virgibacillus profundi TaxID=2024555 RepID=A0A2A2I9L5_9BACI|nr:hypothetical protein CIL05_20005 [Virgibacillus profundi]PXY51962.1 hypothetical protein CIT14_20370 [Virgibacillus profundi]